ncbi:hypothetical protein D3C79_958190 [compost metagenome]
MNGSYVAGKNIVKQLASRFRNLGISHAAVLIAWHPLQQPPLLKLVDVISDAAAGDENLLPDLLQRNSCSMVEHFQHHKFSRCQPVALHILNRMIHQTLVSLG